MSFTPISAAPNVPNSGDPLTSFDADYEAFYTWEKNNLAPGVNAAVTEIDDIAEVVVLAAGEVADNAEAAGVSAAAAAASAASALGAPGTNANSTTSLALTAGAKSWTIQTGKLFPPGAPIFLASAADPDANRMFGILDTHNNTTGACTAIMTPDPTASGTHTDWIMGLGVSLSGVATLPRIARTSNTALTVSEKGKLIDVTSGTFAQTTDAAATLGANWFCYLTNTGTGVVTYDGLAMPQGALIIIQSDGTTVRKYQQRMPDQVLVGRDEKTSGTGPATLTSGAWTTRVLNTTTENTIPGASIASNEVTLPAGKYQITASAPATGTNGHKLRVYNVTAAAVAYIGTTDYAPSGSVTRSTVNCEITLAVTSAIRLEHWVSFTSGGGTAISSGAVEVYAEIFIRKVG